MNSIHRVLYLLVFSLFFNPDISLAQCGGISFSSPVIESSGLVRVDVNYTNSQTVTFQDFDVHVTFSGLDVDIDFTTTNNSTGSGYSATQFGSNPRVVQITGQNFSFGSTVTICKIYFELPAGECTDVDFTRISNILDPFVNCNMSNTLHNDIPNWCKPAYSINGKVENLPYGVHLQDVKLTAEDISTAGFPDVTDITNSSGNYDLDNLEEGGDYRVSCEKLNNNPTCGITTSDMTAILEHINGQVSFQFPWQYMAADVSGNRFVTTQDIILIQALLLNGTNLPKEWTFISSTRYANIGIPPAPFKEYVQYNDLSQNQNNKVFYAVKGGDVNGVGCATPGQLRTSEGSQEDVLIKSRRSFRLGNIQGEPGDEVLIPVYAAKFKRQSLFSLSLAFDHDFVEVLEIVNPNLPEFTESDYTINHDQKGTLDVLWFTVEKSGVSLRPNEPLFYIKLRAKQSFQNLRPLVQLRSSRMENTIHEVGSRAGESIQLVMQDLNPNEGGRGLDQSDSGTENTIRVTPNPFSDILNIQFYQPVAGNVLVKIFDQAGKLVLQEKSFFEEGAANFELNQLVQLPKGTFFYQLIQADRAGSGKILKVE